MPLLDEQEIENTAFNAGCHVNQLNDPRPGLTGWMVSDDVLDAFAQAVELRVLDKLRALSDEPVAWGAEFASESKCSVAAHNGRSREEWEKHGWSQLYTADQAAAIALRAKDEGKQERDQLKAEVEQLKSQVEKLQGENYEMACREMQGQEPVGWFYMQWINGPSGWGWYQGESRAPDNIYERDSYKENPANYKDIQTCYAIPLTQQSQPEPLNAMLVMALELAVRQNSHDMLMTGEELRKCEAALTAAKQAQPERVTAAMVEGLQEASDKLEVIETRRLERDKRLAAFEQAQPERVSLIPCRCFDEVSKRLCLDNGKCVRIEAYGIKGGQQ